MGEFHSPLQETHLVNEFALQEVGCLQIACKIHIQTCHFKGDDLEEQGLKREKVMGQPNFL